MFPLWRLRAASVVLEELQRIGHGRSSWVVSAKTALSRKDGWQRRFAPCWSFVTPLVELLWMK
jgi:hypothetical protein